MKKILIVEDDICIRELLVDVLEDQGYQAYSSTNGLEGIKSLETQAPDLIIMDIMMPVMDGYTFKNVIQTNPKWNQIPVIGMSAENQSLEKLSDHAITNFISKPFLLDHLLKTIKSIVNQDEPVLSCEIFHSQQ